MSTTQPVDLVDLCALAGMPYVPDPRGRIFIGAPEAGEIAITPSVDGGYGAAVSLIEAGRFVRANHDDISPGAAAERVLLFCALADRRRREGAAAADEIDRRLQAAIMAAPTLGDTTGQQAAAIAKSQILGPDRTPSRNALTDPFERHWLKRAFSIGRALDDAEPRPNAHDPWGYGDGLVMEFGMPAWSATAPDDAGKSVVSLIRTAGEPWVRGAVHAGEGEAASRVGFCLCAESALLLLAVEEGLRHAMSPDLRLDLARLRGDVIAADVGWRAGFRRLTELFAPWAVADRYRDAAGAAADGDREDGDARRRCSRSVVRGWRDRSQADQGAQRL